MLNKSTHQKIMFAILKQIYSNPKLASILGFKGGTALYFCYELPRFSVDLDFNLLDLEQEDFVFENILDIAKQYGLVKAADNKRVSLHYSISYKENNQKLKIDISKRQHPAKYELRNILGLAMKVMVIEDIFAYKLVAASERYQTAIRDLYDINYLLDKHYTYNRTIIETRIGSKVQDYFEELINIVENYKPVNILSEIGELLDDKQKTYVQEKMMQDLLFSLKMQLKFLKEC